MNAVERPSGIILPRACTFDEVIRPIKGELSMWCWWVCSQQGSLDSRWVYSCNHERIVDRLRIVTPELQDACISVFGRGFVPKLHEHVLLDEWTYFYASSCDPGAFPQRAIAAERRCYKLGSEFFRLLAETGDLFIMHVDGWWEIYTGDPEWQGKWTNHFPDAFGRSWKQAGDLPVGN